MWGARCLEGKDSGLLVPAGRPGSASASAGPPTFQARSDVSIMQPWGPWKRVRRNVVHEAFEDVDPAIQEEVWIVGTALCRELQVEAGRCVKGVRHPHL